MQRQLIFKIVAIFILILLLLIPINMVNSLVYERMSLRNDVVSEIANSYSKSQQIKGPVLIIPYSKLSYNTEDKKYYQRKGTLYFLPEQLNMTGYLNVEKRSRGIYEARVYNSKNKMTGSFDIPKDYGVKENLEDYQFGQPFLAIGISDTRGIGNQSTVIFDNKTLSIKPGTAGSKLGSGIHAQVTLTDAKLSGIFPFEIQFDLKGTSTFNLMPVGKETSVTIDSNWPHPSFSGSFLPISHDIKNEGFTATWQTNLFASDIENKFKDCLTDKQCYSLENTNFQVGLVEPVDHYSKTNRAIKYGILFIGLTFFGFFIFEVVRKLAIHPIQYSFVGMSLAIFFLLLLSLSEYIGFALAYLCSAIACISIISFYITGILENKKQAIIFTCLLSLIYLMLYVLLNAEEYSLMMGSILVFMILSTAMIATRRLDWYQVTTQNPLTKYTKQSKETHHE
ncbi:cell envelope integrity protein CreD [Gammaproteobacteria bacterium ESL0073]|nr:cell envelope integrity protein CreD [Gammaproteobacteria bacterium ESL0073]